MILKHVIVGLLRTNCYLVCDEQTKTCAVIDPGAKAASILEAAAETGCRVEKILLTHGHYDHVMAAPELLRQTGARLYISKKDEWLLSCDEVLRYGTRREGYAVPHVDEYLEEGKDIALGSLTFRVLETPGHTAGSCTLLCEDSMFSGDTLFHECCGRCDLETGSMEDMMASLKKLALLPGNYQVYPGHESFSMLDYERQYNPYMKEAMRR